MSHVADVDLEIKDLDSLESACKELGLELVRDQKTYKWWGTHVGDYPLPKGFTKNDMGKCEHAVRIPGNSEAYEIGICKRRDGRPGFTPLWDFFGSHGKSMMNVIGKEGEKLKQEYAAQVATKHARKKGFTVTRTIREGNIILNARRLARS